jgi:hypothetical protein
VTRAVTLQTAGTTRSAVAYVVHIAVIATGAYVALLAGAHTARLARICGYRNGLAAAVLIGGATNTVRVHDAPLCTFVAIIPCELLWADVAAGADETVLANASARIMSCVAVRARVLQTATVRSTPAADPLAGGLDLECPGAVLRPDVTGGSPPVRFRVALAKEEIEDRATVEKRPLDLDLTPVRKDANCVASTMISISAQLTVGVSDTPSGTPVTGGTLVPFIALPATGS